MHYPGFMALVTWVKFLGEKLKVTIPLVNPCCVLRVDGCVFCSISLLSDYMCVRIPLSSRSIVGVSSSRALPGPGFLSKHLSAFLIDGCVATK